MADKRKWRVKSEEVVHQNPWYKVVKEELETGGGQKGTYFVTVRDDFVVVIPLTDEDEVIMVEMYKPTSREWVLGLPMGMIDEGESVEKAALRELEEESGFKGKKVEFLGEFFPAIGSLRQKGTTVIVRGLTKSRQKLEELEEGARVVRVAVKDLVGMIETGRFRDGSTLAALALFFGKNDL